MTPHEAAITLEWVTGEFMLRWLERVPGVTIEWFGWAWGSCAPDRPELDFHNTVHRLLPDDVEQVPRIAERYAAAGVRPWLELMANGPRQPSSAATWPTKRSTKVPERPPTEQLQTSIPSELDLPGGMNHQLLDLVNRSGHVAGELAAKGLSDKKVAVSLMNGSNRSGGAGVG